MGWPGWFIMLGFAVLALRERWFPEQLRAAVHEGAPLIGAFFILLGVIGLVVNFQIADLKTPQIEVGYVYSHSNELDPEHPWEEWDQPISDRLRFVGVNRKMYFGQPFKHRPEVEVALALIDLAPLESVMREVGCKVTDPQEARLLQHLHVNSFVSDVESDHFVLNIGVGVPEHCGAYLIAYLHKKAPDRHSLEYALTKEQLGPKTMSNELTLQEKWMINFWTTVGTVKVTWIAIAGQK
jgi:hypothetical protein